MVAVFDSFDTDISISKQTTKTKNVSISNTGTITIDNKGCELSHPVLTITTSTSATLSSAFLVQNGNNFGFTSDIVLSSTDTLVLDFAEQNYKLNGNVIYDVNIDELIKLNANQETSINVTCTGDINIQIDYKGYEISDSLQYVEGWNLDTKLDYATAKPINSNKKNGDRLESVDYSFSINKMDANWNLYNSISNEDRYRITYEEYNPETYELETKYLVGVRFTNYKKSFQMGEFIITDISGECNDILTKQ